MPVRQSTGPQRKGDGAMVSPPRKWRCAGGWSPFIVARIEFLEWTLDNRLRHPRFAGIRNDKDAREVVREELGFVAPQPPARTLTDCR